MKLIVANVRPDCLEALQEALDEPGVGLTSVSHVLDVREPCPRNHYRGGVTRAPRARLRLEVVVVNEMLLEWAVATITRVASANERERLSHGEILVMPLDDYARIAALDAREEPSEDRSHAGVLPPLDLSRPRF